MTIRRTLFAAVVAVATIVVAPAAASAVDDPYGEPPYEEPCQYDPSISAESPDCYPVCEYDDSLPADDENCDPCFDPYSEYPGCEEPTTTTEAPETTTTTLTPQPSTTTEPPRPTTTSTTSTTSTSTTTSTTTTAPLADPTQQAASGVLPASGGRTIVQQAPVQQAAELPATGSDQSLITTMIALAFVAGGAALVAATRRNKSA